MFGTNQVTKQDLTKEVLSIKEIFHTIQGEGPFVGTPSIFIRLGGCNLKCHFCFGGNTLVAMGNGRTKKIKDVKEGEEVISFNENTNQIVKSVVKKVMIREVEDILKITLTSNQPLFCTAEHPFYVVGKGWVKAHDLTPEDILFKLTESSRKKIANPMFSKETCKKVGKTLKQKWKIQEPPLTQLWKKPEFRTSVKERMKNNNPMKREEIAIKSWVNRKHKINKIEKLVLDIAKEEMLPLRYVGDGSLIINNKNPDFIFDGTKKLVEVWDYTRPNNDRDEKWINHRKSLFQKEGFDCLCLPLSINPFVTGVYGEGVKKFKHYVKEKLVEFLHNGYHIKSIAKVTRKDKKSFVRLTGGLTKNIKVYNLEVENTRTYFANNCLVHNCDTNFTSDLVEMTEKEVVLEVVRLTRNTGTHLVVITGGEPLIQNISPLIRKLFINGYQTQIETAGTVWITELEHLVLYRMCTIVCSPKTPVIKIPPHLIFAWKYIIKEGEVGDKDGLPIYSTQEKGKPQILARPPKRTPTDKIFIQPCDEYLSNQERDVEKNERNQLKCVEIALKHGYRISLQTHKILGLR